MARPDKPTRGADASTTAAAVAIAAILAVAWYTLVEWLYFKKQGPTFRRIFAQANDVSPSASFSYRAPWLAAVTYAALVGAFALLAVWPAVEEARTRGSRRPCLWKAYVACLWRAVLLAAAVYCTYDFTTYATVFPFPLAEALSDLLYGAVFLPLVVIAPSAVLVAYAAGPKTPPS